MIGLFKFNKETLNYERIKPRQYVKVSTSFLVVCVVLFTIGWMTGTNKYIINKLIHKTEVTDTLVVHDEPFTEEALIETIKNCNLHYPYIVLAQAKLESDHFRSAIFRQNHNMFGMRKAHQRITAAEREKNTYAYYRDWKDGLYDYAMYQATVLCDINSESQYFAKLGERYAEDTSYVSKLKAIIEKERLKDIFEE